MWYRRIVLTAACALSLSVAFAQETLDPSVISASRPLLTVGEKETAVDSAALRESPALSLSDILSYNSSVYVKQYGRSSYSTVSFRGTSPSHTQVLWNGMKINSPMLGMTDFSVIPAFLVDAASLLHGTSSLKEASGTLGGAVVLSSAPPVDKGWSLKFIQGAGSFLTFDDYLGFGWSTDRFSVSTRLSWASSANRFKYVNRDKIELVYDDDMNVIDTYHPVEYNENGSWRQWHILQEFRYTPSPSDVLSLSVWYSDVFRNVPRLSVEYGNPDALVNTQADKALRATALWKHLYGTASSVLSASYAFGNSSYKYSTGRPTGLWSHLIDSRSLTHTVALKTENLWHLGDRIILVADCSAQYVKIDSEESIRGTGHNADRAEISAYVSFKWQPFKHFGFSASVREELIGNEISCPMPALNADILLCEKINLYLKASGSRNYRYPTLEDKYCLPGGNPDLRPESGWFYDAGYSLALTHIPGFYFSAEGGWFDSYIDDWILWLPYGARKDIYTPVNVLKVRAYGVEQTLKADWRSGRLWKLSADGNFTWSPSINRSGTGASGDASIGRQLVYIPLFSASATITAQYRTWSLKYKWCHYSRRYTMSSNELTASGSIPPYFMNDIILTKDFVTPKIDISLSLAVNNIFNESYVTVLSRPMPGTNFEFFLSITPKFSRR